VVLRTGTPGTGRYNRSFQCLQPVRQNEAFAFVYSLLDSDHEYKHICRVTPQRVKQHTAWWVSEWVVSLRLFSVTRCCENRVGQNRTILKYCFTRIVQRIFNCDRINTTALLWIKHWKLLYMDHRSALSYAGVTNFYQWSGFYGPPGRFRWVMSNDF